MFGYDKDEALDDLAKEWRSIFLDVLRPYVHLPLILSGGTDSGTILAGLLTLGAKPDCYTFQLGEYVSPDLLVATKMCQDHDLTLNVSKIDRDYKVLKRDVYELITLLKTYRKTSIQCSQPILYMSRQLVKDGWSRAIIGTGSIVLDGKECAIIYHKEGEEAARKYRTEKQEDRYKDCGTGHMHRTGELLGVHFEEPLTDEPLKSFGLKQDYAELNWPKQKGIALRAFPKFWSKGYYRTNNPLQVGTGIRAWHDTLLDSDLNTMNAKRVVAIYRRIYMEANQ